MDRQEFLRRRRALEELYQADLRLLRAAHEARVRSLEALWMDLQPDELPAPAPVPLLPAAEEAPAPGPEPQEPEPIEAVVRNPDLRVALEEILPELPVVFEKKDVVRELGWTPSRSSLQRVLADMVFDKRIAFESYSGGRTPSRYRRL